jgi:hypothetical protein
VPYVKQWTQGQQTQNYTLNMKLSLRPIRFYPLALFDPYQQCTSGY